MIKYSVIGTSWITNSFISGAQNISDLVLDGVYSRSTEKGEDFKNQTGAKRVFSSFEDLLESDTDLVYVASPNVCHYAQCKDLLLNGKHVLCEKPVTVTADELRELLALAKEKGLVYFEAIMYMHNPAREILKDAVSKIGNVTSASFDFSQLSSKYPALVQGLLPNIFNPQMKTGALNDLGVYCVYPAVDLFGIPEEIIPSQSFLSTGADGCGSAIFKYADKLVTITYSKIAQSRGVSQIFGDKGTITIESISQTDGIALYDNSGNKTVLVPHKEKSELMGNEAASAVEFIKNPTNNPFLEECGTMSLKVLECMEKMRVSNA